MSGRYRLAIVVPRYGEEVNGGAETLAREYAHRLAPHVDVTVLTTCALDYRTWEDHFPSGPGVESGVRVIRFPVPVPRDEKTFDAISAHVLTGPSTREEQLEWMDAQGPVSPELEDHLRERGAEYDGFLFIPYLYATTFRGLPLVAERSTLVGAFHEEPPLALGLFDDLVAQAGAVVASTPEEHALARRRFGVPESRLHVVGAGIDRVTGCDPGAFGESLGLMNDYVLALGRIDPSKGSTDLIAFHRQYRATRPYGLDLVMVGRSVIDLPDEPWLHAVGFVDEDKKHEAIAGCTALVSASPFESLSLVLLEAWAQGRPTVVTTKSDVLLGQTRRAGAGLWFESAEEYGACLDLFAARAPIAWSLGRAGWRFARQLDWDSTIRRLLSTLPGSPPPHEAAG